MNAYTFRRFDTSRARANNTSGSTSTRRTINFNDRFIYLSCLLAEQLHLKEGSHIAFTMDEDKPERIYVRQADDIDDTRDIQCALSSQRRDRRNLRCSNKAVVEHVLYLVGATTSCTCYVAPNATKIGGKDHYQILVDCPLMIK